MRVISTRAHSMMDYVAGVVLIAAPWLFGFSDSGGGTWTMIIVGVVVLMQALMTDYEGGVMRVIPMPIHLMMDAVAGIVLIVAPWAFGFSDETWVPFVVFGVLELGAAMTTQKTPSSSRLLSANRAGAGAA